MDDWRLVAAEGVLLPVGRELLTPSPHVSLAVQLG